MIGVLQSYASNPLEAADSFAEYIDEIASEGAEWQPYLVSKMLRPFSAGVYCITGIGYTILGSLTGILGVCLAGTSQTLNKTYTLYLGGEKEASALFAKPFLELLKIVNPEAEIIDENQEVQITKESSKHIIGYKTLEHIEENIEECAEKEDSFIHQHFFSRFHYAKLGVTIVVTQVAAIIFSLLAICLSFSTLGKEKMLNTLTYRSLLAIPCMEATLFFCITKILNPWADYGVR